MIKSFLNNSKLRYRLLLLFLTGVMMALAMPPVNAFPVLWICLPILYMAIDTAKSKKQAFFVSWIFGVGYFVAGLYWVTFALFVDLEQWWWLIPFALFLGPIVLALYIGIFGLSCFILFNYFQVLGRISLFTLLFGIISYLQGVLFTGFPWNLLGYTWSGSLAVLQNLSWSGIYGLTILTVFCAALPVVFLLNQTKRIKIISISISILIPLLMWSFGTWRLADAGETEFNSDVVLRVVQGGIPQKDKWEADKQVENFNIYLDYSNQSWVKKPTHIIWPETTLTVDIKKYKEAGRYLRERLPKGIIFLTGNVHQDEKGYYNSLLAMDVDSGYKEYFNKTHLVPFGEYVPFRKLLSFGALGAVVSGFEDFSEGQGIRTVDFKNTPLFSSLICYEIIFSDKVISATAKRPEWMLNVTNDGWYGKTSGPYQHLAFSRARAIEEGLPLVRAAGTGVSAIIDAYGRIIDSVALGEGGVIDSTIPKNIKMTIYATYRGTVFLLFLLVLSGFTMFFRSRT